MKQPTIKQILDLCKSYSVMYMFGNKESYIEEQITKQYDEILSELRKSGRNVK